MSTEATFLLKFSTVGGKLILQATDDLKELGKEFDNAALHGKQMQDDLLGLKNITDVLMATFSTLTGVSGNTAEVSTQLAAIFTALVKPSSEAAEMAAQMGIQFDAAAIKAKGSMQSFIKSLDATVKQYAASSGMLEQEIYGKLFGSAESLRTLIPLTNQLADKFDENVAAMQSSAGTINEAFAQMEQTSGAALQSLKNNIASITDGPLVLMPSERKMSVIL